MAARQKRVLGEGIDDAGFREAKEHSGAPRPPVKV